MAGRNASDATDLAVSRPARRRTPLTTERVLTAALAIVDADGADALSMRRLAQSLDREVMTLYRYARNKAALLDGVVERVLGELVIDPDADDWHQELRRLAREFRRLALDHPHVVPLMVTRPLIIPLGLRPPGTLRPVEDFLQLLVNAGFNPTDALEAYRLFFGFLHGYVLDELQEVVVNPAENEAVLRLGLHNLPLSDFPQLRALAPELDRYDGAGLLERGVDLMITGLQAHFRPPPPASSNARHTSAR
jgi:AcrR family transcriptional regulator